MSSDVIDKDDAENNESLMAADNRLFPSSFDYFDYNQGISNLAVQGLVNQGFVISLLPQLYWSFNLNHYLFLSLRLLELSTWSNTIYFWKKHFSLGNMEWI